MVDALRPRGLAVRDTAAFTVPSTWRKSTTYQGLDEKIAIAGRALKKSIGSLDPNTRLLDGDSETNFFGDASEVYAQMAMYDLFTNNTKYKSQIQNNLMFINQSAGQFRNTYLNYPAQFGIASMRAYSAYLDSSFLDLAKEAWAAGAEYTIPQSAEVPSTSSKRISLCPQYNLAGGTFWNTMTNDSYVNVQSTGNMLLLSSLLAKATSDNVYIQAAKLSKDFIISYLRSPVNGTVADGILVDSCTVDLSNHWPFNTALFIEGSAVLADLTDDTSLKDIVRTTINSTLSSNVWQGADGIIVSSQNGIGDPDLFRALAQVYNLNPVDEELRTYLAAYLSVQYNALLDLASNGSDIYAASWRGPPPATFDAISQRNAVVGLVSMIGLDNSTQPSASSSSIPSSTLTYGPTASPPLIYRQESTNVFAILGGIIGAFVVLIVIIFLLRCRRRHRTVQKLNAITWIADKDINFESISEALHGKRISWSSEGSSNLDQPPSYATRLSYPPIANDEENASPTQRDRLFESSFENINNLLRPWKSNHRRQHAENEEAPPSYRSSTRSFVP